MPVIHVSTSSRYGGAANAAKRLDRYLVRGGRESVLCASDCLKEAGIKGLMRLLIWSRRKLASRIEQLLIQLVFGRRNYCSLGLLGSGILRQLKKREDTIINLHWCTGGFVGLQEIARLSGRVVWTLHDVWPITPGIQHIHNKSRYEDGFVNGLLPFAGFKVMMANRIEELVNLRKKEAVANVDVFVCPSSWMLKQLQGSHLGTGRQAVVIPNAVDEEFFMRDIRNDWDEDLFSIVVAGFNIEKDDNKGLDLLIDAVDLCEKDQGPKKRILIAGGSSRYVERGETEIVTIPYVGSAKELSGILSSADICIIPSRFENLCTVALEAMSCGVGVIAFDMGGMPDIVDNGVNGYLIEPYKTDELAAKIDLLSSDRALCKRLGKRAREKAFKAWHPDVIANIYDEMYTNLGKRAENIR